MGKIEKTTISLPSEMLAEIKAAVEAGDYANTSEAVRDAVRQWQRSRAVIVMNDDELRRMVEDARASGEPVGGKTALASLRSKYEAMARRNAG